jgi:phospholipid/cholesterol/gamma-HCH transport system permease protein
MKRQKSRDDVLTIRVERQGDRASVAPAGLFDLAHAASVAQAIDDAEPAIKGCVAIDVQLSELTRIDGSGAALLARLLDRVAADPRCTTNVVRNGNPEAARLIALYRGQRTIEAPPPPRPGRLARLGEAGAQLPGLATGAFNFVGSVAVALPRAALFPRSVDWRSLPRLIQEVGADALPVTSAANLLVGLIVGFLGVSQLGRFGAVIYVPELVVVAQFRELGPLVTCIVVAGRSGAGLASELATMKVSEEIDALRSMGFDPVSWLVLPRCLALVLTVPLLTWIGDMVALAGGLAATTFLSGMTSRAYVLETLDSITAAHLLTGLVKSPFLALAIGLVACRQGLAAHGGAAAVGARTTTAVVLSIFAVIVVSAVFTFFFALLGI